MTHGRFSRQAGFTMISAIFILVVLAALGAFITNISATQQIGSAQDVQGARAYQAARAGIEWGFYQVLDPANGTAVAPTDATWPNLTCPAAATTLTIEGFNVQVQCNRSVIYNENGNSRSIAVYTLISKATFGSVGTPGYVERQLTADVSKCRRSDGVAPGYGCD